MDGIISDSMKSHGIVYKINYGVSITRIREIAKHYTNNHDLAQRLWLLNIRETMIMATLLQPAETFTPKLASSWLEQCNNIELIEQATMNLYQHLNFAPDFSLNCIESDKILHKIFGFTLALRIYHQLSPTEIEKILQLVQQLNIPDNENTFYNSVAICLARLSRKDEATARLIYTRIRGFANNPFSGKNHIYQTVKQELIFLGILDENL